MKYLLLFLCLVLASELSGQEKQQLSKTDSTAEFYPLNKCRLYGLTGSAVAIYTGITYSLSTTWYSEFDQSSFHFYNDNGEWLQMDKAGHSWTTYAEARYGMGLYRWTGLTRRQAAWTGVAWAMTAQLTIEVLDGFSTRWGASPGDLLANSAGAGFLLGQEYLWNEQRMLLKFSSHSVDYSNYDAIIQERAGSLFGRPMRERLLKDYNGQSYWLSFNPLVLTGRSSAIPEWLCVSLGYGAEGILGGFENEWIKDDELIVRNDVQRVRQFYLSLDVDFSRIKTRSSFLKTIFEAVNILKIPAPALELNSKGDLKFHAVYW